MVAAAVTDWRFMSTSRSLRAALVAASLLVTPFACNAQVFSVGVSVRLAPPALPVYVQPVVPGPGYIWAPGYWAWGADGYFWVPGTWVLAPTPGLLWTPGYWGWGGGLYLWHAGYWGPHVGFYGGVNYGFGYGGVGYGGGYWNRGNFVYNRTVINNVTVNRVSYNGGNGGIMARPNAEEQAAAHEPHRNATDLQSMHEHAASTNRAFLASVNHGAPRVTATAHPGVFNEHNYSAGGRPSQAGRPQPGMGPRQDMGQRAPMGPRQAMGPRPPSRPNAPARRGAEQQGRER